ncbi:Uncharacterised protein [Moraxella lacunata]|uniref:Uncharacterized protein n=1 Tax=Moraxella lacunata TaxID=477 RepID=A0A378QIK9_MORLA|nr:hypothetical protein [Moraxella lacunata]STY99163.1 Uncharacterised protein [Moraxella lacunata]
MAKQSDKQAEQGVMTDDVSVSTQTHSQDKPKRTRKKKDPADVALDVQVGDVSAVSDTAGQPKSTKAKVKADQTKAKQAKTSQIKNTQDTDNQAKSQTDNPTAKPKRTRKKAVKADISEEAHAQQAVDESATDERGRPRFGAKEAILEFVEVESGSLVLREVGTDEALVSIAFADKVKDMVGAEHIQSIGQHMISAAIATVMERQMRQYHAHVYDEAPKRFS